MRYREDTSEEQERAREAVVEWRGQNPEGTPEDMLAAIGGGFHKDYAAYLRVLLYRADLRSPAVADGITAITGEIQ